MLTYSQSIEFLYGLRTFGTKLGLEKARRLAELAGNPQEQLRFIHVAGTNGKGSTCAMLESIYREAGLKVGLFTSPHLVHFGERIQVNRRLLSEDETIRHVTELRSLLKAFPDADHPTFFEIVTIMALRHFVEQKCDLVVWETGMGGRLDATNIVRPLVSVITNIQLDHQSWLGDTLALIAYEKAGIIKSGIPVVTAVAEGEAREVILKVAASHDARVRMIEEEHTRRPPLDTIELPLLGDHQKWNAAVALGVVTELEKTIAVQPGAIERGLRNTRWAGRLQVVKRANGQTILFDGAHNAAGAASLRDALVKHFPRRKPAIVIGMLRDKDWKGMCGHLAPLANRIEVVPVKSERTAFPDEIRAACQVANPHALVNTHASLADALAATASDHFVLVTGSLHFIGEAMEQLQVVDTPFGDERRLNEWDALANNIKQN